MSFLKVPEEDSVSPEEVLSPPKIDFMGIWLVSILSIVVWFLWWMIVVLLSFLFFGTFSFESGISPILLAMITFFALSFSNFAFLWWITNIFPEIYTRARTFFVQISIFCAVLYIVMIPLYLFSMDMLDINARMMLIPYIIHILLNLFGLFLLVSLISHYRYSILSFYISFISLIITGIMIFAIQNILSNSGSALFLLIGSMAIGYFVFTIAGFGLFAIYFQFYKNLWIDPIGNVFGQIQKEEKQREILAEKMLLWQK